MVRTITVIVLLCVISFVIVVCNCQIQASPSSAGTKKPVPDPTFVQIMTPTPKVASSTGISRKALSAINHFYQAIEKQSYSAAYSDLDTDAVVSNRKTTNQTIFLHLARSQDSIHGPIDSFSFTVDPADPKEVTMTLICASGLHYHAHLLLKNKYNTWKIDKIDII